MDRNKIDKTNSYIFSSVIVIKIILYKNLCTFYFLYES